MKKTLSVLLLLIVVFTLFAEDRGLTIRELKPDIKSDGGIAPAYIPPLKQDHSGTRTDPFCRDTWAVVDSIYFDTFITNDNYMGAKFNSEDGTIEFVSNLLELSPESEAAVAKAPTWIRPSLINTLRQLDLTNQQKWAEVINDAVDPYIDEIAFSVASSSIAYLSSQYAYTELFEDNAFFIYEIDNDLSYVEVVDYGHSYTDEDYYSTTRYWKKDEDGILSQVEVPREIYYWYIVHPKLTDEIPAYIDPTIIESNGSHTNNITGPEDGVFWREYLYNHNDEGYPRLKYVLQNCDIVLNRQEVNSASAVGAMGGWIGQSMTFTSNYERPHQPVRIYTKHIGRCGEYADMRVAVGRLGLIPTTSILCISGDHTWNHIWDEEWVHWDGYIDNPLVYENGWGKVFGSVFEIRSDGVLTPVTDMYSEGWATLEIYVLDSNGDPVDGARILLATGTPNVTDNVGFTDNEGKYIFIVGDDRNYSASVSSSIGNMGYQEIVTNTVHGQTYTHSITLSGTMPSLDFTSIATPGDTTDDYKIFVDFSAENQIIRGLVPMDDINNSYFHHSQEDGLINFLMASEDEYNNYNSGSNCDVFNEQINVENGTVEFDIPVAENWFTILDNGNRLNNPQHVTGWISLYSYDEIGGMGSIVGIVNDPINSVPVEGAIITAGVYQTTTEADGTYSMAVYPNTYNVIFEAEGYEQTIQNNIVVTNEEITNVDAEMMELIYAPINVEAQALDNGNALISWDEPIFVSTQLVKNTLPANRELTGYNLFVGESGDENNVGNWSLVASGVSENSYEDIIWSVLNEGIYKYTVRAVYTNNILSNPMFSNILFKDKFVPVDAVVYTNCGDSADGALVNLKNQDCTNTIYEYNEIVENNSVQFESIFKGIYTLTVSFPYFEDFIIEDIEIFEETTLQALLDEIISEINEVCVINYMVSWEPVPADEANRSFQNYNIFVDDMITPVATVYENYYDVTSIGSGMHEVGISAVFSSGESAITNLEYEDGNSMFTDIVAYYELNGDATDSSGNGNDGEIFGDITFVDDGVIGLCAEYDEEAEYILAPDVFTVAPEAFTISWWILPDTTFNWNQQVKSVAGWDAFVFHSGNNGIIYAGTTTATRFNPNTCSEGVTLDEWQFFTYSFENGNACLFKNGHKIAQKGNMNAPIAWDGFILGSDAANTIDGKVDDVRIWERWLGAAEIGYLFTENYPFWGTIEGTVTSAINGDPVEGAKISIGMFEAITNASGSYSMDVAACSYPIIECEVGDYDVEFVEDIIVADGETLMIDFEYGFVGSEDPIIIPQMTKLHNNYPNPFNPTTTISFDLTSQSTENTELIIYNIKGQKVKQLFKEQLTSGQHSVVWNGTDENNQIVSSGIYFYQLKVGKDFSQTKRMLLLK